MKKPDWQETYRDFPKIPEFKRWVNGQNLTCEQDVSFRLLHKQPITQAEERQLRDTETFYSELEAKLRAFDYQFVNDADRQNFINYIQYAFNFNVLATNNVTIKTVYRTVVNESVLGSNQRIEDISYIKYPPQDIVQKIGKYNRANTPETNLFYCSENIDTTLKEIRPSPNKLVTVGVWEPTDEGRFIVNAITHSDAAAPINEGVKHAQKYFEDMRAYNHELFMEYIQRFQSMLGYEYTKQVKDHHDYLISAYFSESLLKDRNEDDEFGIVGILYPSVGNGYVTDNFAFLPNVVDSRLRLRSVLEFEVEEPYYDKDYQLDHPEKITLARIKNVSVAKSVTPDGKILWT